MKRITVICTLISAAVLVSAQSDVRTGTISQGIFYQEGIASWYGGEFNGKPTASGEIFNDSQFTAAHPLLPFGTMLKITNRHNNKSVTVRVNDRGPFVAARIIDLSRAAAAQLDMISTGTAPVMVESLDVVTLSARPQDAAPSAAAVQAGAPQAVTPAASATAAAPVSPAQTAVPQTAPVMPAASPQAVNPGDLQPGDAFQVRPGSVEPYSGPVLSAVPETLQPAPGPAQFPVPAAQLKPGIPPADTGKYYRVQVGAYKQPRYAVEAFEKLKKAGLHPAYEKHDEYYRVVLSGLRQQDLGMVTERLGQAGFREALLREE
ncbi:MAG: septal ring lytic transglycosylase RlpA family protein [Treponema sp.]|jgi:rare lipoprotein A|nr:septal ring lytic transglycosylase RlpA family protein [Treponema sp.]